MKCKAISEEYNDYKNEYDSRLKVIVDEKNKLSNLYYPLVDDYQSLEKEFE